MKTFYGMYKGLFLCQSLNCAQQLNVGRHNSTPLCLIAFDLAWRLEKSSLIIHFHLQAPKSRPAAKQHWNFLFLLLKATLASPLWRLSHAASLCHISSKSQHKGGTSGVSPPFCVSIDMTYVTPSLKISECLLVYCSLDTPRGFWSVPVCAQQLIFQQCLHFPSVLNFKFSSIYSATTAS